MTTELDSFADAAERAVAELEAATSDDAESSSPEDEAEAPAENGQAEADESEQTASQPEATEDADDEDSEDEQSEEEESLFSDLEIEDDDEESSEPELSDDLMIDLGPGKEPVTLRELKDRGLRLDDYTRKSQANAEERKANEKAIKLWDALQKEPLAVAKQLAVEAGLLDKEATPVRAVEFSTVSTAEELEAEIEKRVEAAVEEHPDVKEARQQQALQVIGQEFDRIEGELDVSLNKATRDDILREAKRRGVNDLELVASNMLARKQRLEAKRRELREGAPKRPSGQTQEKSADGPADSFEEAKRRALLELGMAD